MMSLAFGVAGLAGWKVRRNGPHASRAALAYFKRRIADDLAAF